MPKIRVISDKAGVPVTGDVIEVSDDRSARWIKDRLAVSAEPRSEKKCNTKKMGNTKTGESRESSGE